ncbi:histone-lysine N-methyltransferase SETMAR [Trichonephila clavipes]|nr:histone-lysine N-methyltransferase SETMAR [Trichonephila clavipes]
MLVGVYEDQALSLRSVYEWFARFREGRESVSDNSRRERPATSVSDENIAKINKLIAKDCQLNVCMIGLKCNHPWEDVATRSRPGVQESRKCKPGVAEIANDIYGVNTETANYVQFWFRRFRSGIFDIKDAPRTGRLVVEYVHKITEIIKIDRYTSRRSIAQELKIDHKTVLSHLRKVRFK